jgi:hypothetical protein
MAEDKPSKSCHLTAAARRKQRAKDRYRELCKADPNYHKKRYQRWLELNPNGNREAYLRKLARQSNSPDKRPKSQPLSAEEKRERQRRRDREKYLRTRLRWIARVKARQKQRYHEDPEYMLRIRLRNRIRYALKAGHGRKVRRSQELLGCSSDQFVKHIESLFTAGMSWDNKGQWHIDHIIPVAAFDLTTLDGQQAAFHYTNLRPAWAEENRRKNARVLLPQKLFPFGYVMHVDRQNKSRARNGGQITERT